MKLLTKNTGARRSSLTFSCFYLCRLAEKLLAEETLSLPDIDDILGQRPFPIKDTLKEYLQELRDRKDKDDETAEEEKKAEAMNKAAMDATKYDPDAEEPPSEDKAAPENQQKSDSAAASEESKEQETSKPTEEEKK